MHEIKKNNSLIDALRQVSHSYVRFIEMAAPFAAGVAVLSTCSIGPCLSYGIETLG